MGTKKIVIVDYEMGNLHSVDNACKLLGYETTISSDRDTIRSASALILPGVGAFGHAMANLDALGLIDPIKDHIQRGNPFLGVCLGFQLLFEESSEFGVHKGLAILKGTVDRFPASSQGQPLKVPHMGWNRLQIVQDNRFSQGLNPNEFMYFVHSYYTNPTNPSIIFSKTTYEGFEYCSSVSQENILAVQFHPEKSSIKGLKLLNNWLTSIE